MSALKTSVSRTSGALAAALMLATSVPALAQNIRIQNQWKPDQQVNVETGDPTSSPTEPGWLSAQWTLEPVAGTNNFRIKNAWKGTYLNVETGVLKATAVEPGWLSAQWRLVSMSVPGTYRIENVWKGTALNIESGVLAASAAPENWQSAVWRLPGYAPSQAVAAAPSSAPLNAASATTAETQVRPASEIIAKPAEIVAQPDTSAAGADCDDTEQLGQCLEENIGKPARDFLTWFFVPDIDWWHDEVAVPLGVSNKPSTYQVQIDFCHSSLGATESADNIKVDFFAGTVLVGSKTVAGNSSDCGTFSKGVLNFYLDTTSTISAITISTDGNDAMFIDQVTMWKGRNQVFWEGRNNGDGWCLSTETNDHIGGWENNVTEPCLSKIGFKKP